MKQFVDLFGAIGADPRQMRIVILTGSGSAFMASIEIDGFDFFTPQGYDKIYREGKKILMNILDIQVPLVAAVNGPVRLHSEYILLADIVLATPSTVFQDKPHLEIGIAPGDGVNLLWPEVIGSVRGRYFLLTRQELDAKTAKEWGVVKARTCGGGRADAPCLGEIAERVGQASAAYVELHSDCPYPEAASNHRRGGRLRARIGGNHGGGPCAVQGG